MRPNLRIVGTCYYNLSAVRFDTIPCFGASKGRLISRGNFRGNYKTRISAKPSKIGIFRANSMVSGPTNLRCSGTIGNDRRGTEFGLKHWIYRCIGLELAYKRWSLTIAEDRGQPDISGVTLGVTLGALLELPREGLLLMQKISAETLCKPIRFEFSGFNSISQFALPN
jgi:hypothetical protein